jgi:hypothetical protein
MHTLLCSNIFSFPSNILCYAYFPCIVDQCCRCQIFVVRFLELFLFFFESVRWFLMASFLFQTSIYDVGSAKSCEDGLESS